MRSQSLNPTCYPLLGSAFPRPNPACSSSVNYPPFSNPGTPNFSSATLSVHSRPGPTRIPTTNHHCFLTNTSAYISTLMEYSIAKQSLCRALGLFYQPRPGFPALGIQCAMRLKHSYFVRGPLGSIDNLSNVTVKVKSLADTI